MTAGPEKTPQRTAQKWINWAHEMEAEAVRLAHFGYRHEAGEVRRASRALGDAGRAALAPRKGQP